jgi:hypothetical protein
MGVADGVAGAAVDVDGLAEDLGRVLASLQRSAASGGGSGRGSGGSSSRGSGGGAEAAAEAGAAPAAGVGLVSEVVAAAERHGLRLPKAFGLLAKQALYFDR